MLGFRMAMHRAFRAQQNFTYGYLISIFFLFLRSLRNETTHIFKVLHINQHLQNWGFFITLLYVVCNKLKPYNLLQDFPGFISCFLWPFFTCVCLFVWIQLDYIGQEILNFNSRVLNIYFLPNIVSLHSCWNFTEKNRGICLKSAQNR